jgi:hypothetical protein
MARVCSGASTAVDWVSTQSKSESSATETQTDHQRTSFGSSRPLGECGGGPPPVLVIVGVERLAELGFLPHPIADAANRHEMGVMHATVEQRGG